jgi:hypothetical protein
MKIEQEKGQRMLTRRPPQNPKLPSLSFSTCCWPVESSCAYVSILSHGLRSKYSIAATTKQTHHKTKNLKNEQTNRQKENRRKRIFLHDQYWVQQLAGRRTQAMKITSKQRRQTAATAAWKYILPALCVCVKIFPSCSGMLLPIK